MITLGFYGAAGTVTGSKYLITANDKRILIDCGMFQGRKELRERNWKSLPFDVTSIDAVILTHAHIDHIGYLPRIVREGYRGPVYATPATIDICKVSLLDTAEIQVEDAEYRNKKRLTRHERALPLFDERDVSITEELFWSVPFGEWTNINHAFRLRYHIVGHLLGAACVEVEVTDGNRTITILFSGDIGRFGNPLTIDPSEPPSCDYFICESTYGGRMHAAEDPGILFQDLLIDIERRKRILLIPAFAIGRTQQIIFLVNELIKNKSVAPLPIHVDSPMAVEATDIYRKYADLHALKDDILKDGADSLLNGKNVHMHRTRQSSKELNDMDGPAIIISSSGMMTGGRIMHHLLNRIDDSSCVVALVGFMAEGTLGRQLADGAKSVYIHKTPKDVNAQIVKMEALSGHADWYEILHWLEPMKDPKRAFITHGEPDQALEMANHLQERRGWRTHIARLDETVEL